MHTKQLQLERQIRNQKASGKQLKTTIFSCVLRLVGGRQFLQKVFLWILSCVSRRREAVIFIVYDFHQPEIFLHVFYIIDRIYPIWKAIPMPI